MQACRGGGELSAMEILEQPNSRDRERGEARRVNVVYFLSWNGRVEHPHLLRIHRLHRDRVHLSDVKRWLSEFRGKDFSDSFAWSYKRRYRGAYIWQDLRDDDLITPFSDNEYVLKGSNQLLAADSPISGNNQQAQGDTCEQMTAEEPLKTAPSAETLHNSSSQDDMNSPKTPPEPDGDTSSDEARKRQAEVEVGEPKEKVKDGGEEKQAAPVTESSRRSSSDGNSCPKRVTQVVCNILRCKTAVETDDSALRPVSRQGRQQSD